MLPNKSAIPNTHSPEYLIWPINPESNQQYSSNFSDSQFQEKSKLVYGVVFSLKNFAKKLGGNEKWYYNLLNFL
jgi:hypothetical protein